MKYVTLPLLHPSLFTEHLPQIYARVAQTWKSGVTRSLDYRRRQLLQLARMVQENKTVWEDAVLADLGKQRQECVSTELGPTVHGALHAAPVFREVIENVLTHLRVAPDKI